MEQVPQQPYTKEFREQAVPLVLEQQLTIPEAARRSSVGCVEPARDAGGEPTARDRAGCRGLSAEARTHRGADGARHLKKSHRVLCHGAAARYALMTTLRLLYPLARRCRGRDETREQARREISEYIESFSNRQRRHSRLGNRSPAAFAQQWARQQPTA